MNSMTKFREKANNLIHDMNEMDEMLLALECEEWNEEDVALARKVLQASCALASIDAGLFPYQSKP